MTDVAERHGFTGFDEILGAEVTRLLYPPPVFRPATQEPAPATRPAARRGPPVNPREPGSRCTNERHGRSADAWGRGCRCPGAIKAHERDLELRRTRQAQRRAAINPTEPCTAPTHSATESAWANGCRCQAAADAHLRTLKRNRLNHAARRNPTLKWRGPDMRVSRINLMVIMAGRPEIGTKMEEILAAHLLLGAPNRMGNGRYGPTEVGERLGISPEVVRKRVRVLDTLRGQRTQRRLADAQWKARRVGKAVTAGRGHDEGGHKMVVWNTVGDIVPPNSCALCGVEWRSHGRRFGARHGGGDGRYVLPGDALRLARMRARRAAR